MSELMTKNFPIFDCDAHINDYPAQYQAFYSEEEKELVKDAYWNHGDYLVLNGRELGGRPAWISRGGKAAHGGPKMTVIDFQGPGMNKKLMRKLYHTPLSEEQLGEIALLGSIAPETRPRDLDLMGIDQVLIIPIRMFTSLPWVENLRAATVIARAYNDWARYAYCDEAPDRMFPAGVLAHQDPYAAADELRRIAGMGFPVASVRPIDARGTYPNQDVYDPIWRAFEETGLVCGMHTVVNGQRQDAQWSPGQIVERALPSQEQIQGSAQTLSFIYEAMTWVTGVLLSGFLERYPALKMAIFESNATWLPMVLEACDQVYHLYGSQHARKVDRLPSEIFHERCLIAFESDEEGVIRRHKYFEDIAIWSSDTYHHDGTDAWDAIERMRKWEVPDETQAKLLGGNARRFYGLEDKTKTFVTKQADPASIARPAWFPKQQDVDAEYARAGEVRAGLR